MKKLNYFFLACLVLILSSVCTVNAVNLLAGWDGNGATGAGSEPNKFGWECTNLNLADWGQANGSSVRYMDNQSYLPGGRLLFVRWDGVGGTNASSVYSYPVQLTAGKTYDFSIKYTRHSNATTNFVLGVNSSKDNSGTSLANGSFAPSTQSFKTATFKLTPFESKIYYVTIAASASGMLGSITGLTIEETVSVLSVDKSSLRLNYFSPTQSILVASNGSSDGINLTAPTGIQLSPASLTSAGGNVIVSSPSKVNINDKIVITQGSDKVEVDVTSDFPTDFFPTAGFDTLTIDGSWCWFADPRALYYEREKEQTYFSWVTREGHIEVASYNHVSGEYKQHRVISNFQADDHANPSLLVRNDGRIIIFAAAHFGEKIHRFISTNPEDITSWSEDYTFSNTVTYPYPFQVGDSICVFYRGGSDWHPRLSVSTDNGQTFDDGRLFISGGGQRPYTRYFQGEDGSIHVAVTTGHPRNEPNNKIHYCRLKGNKVYRANGTLIKDVSSEPVDLSQLEVIYNATVGKGWIWDIALEPGTGYPIVVYASFPSDTDHRYHYGRWNGTAWENTQITEAGRWFPQTPEGKAEPEPNYSGGIILDTDNPSVVYLSKEVNGVFEIFKYTTSDNGKTWSIKALTWDTPSNLLNVRPIVPRNHKEGFFDVIWMRGTYEFYANLRYNTTLVFPATQKIDALTSIKLNKNKLSLLPNESESLKVEFTPFLTQHKSLTWSSSNESVATVVNGQITAIAPGKATITASGYNGLQAQCEVNVDELVLFFDFGTNDSPLAPNAVRVTESNLWDSGATFGWTGTVSSRNRGGSLSAEDMDFNMASQATVFRVKIENGDYDVILKQGDASYMHDLMTVKVNNEIKLSGITSAAGQILTNRFPVSTSTGQLAFEFSRTGTDPNWVVNSLKIIKASSSTTGLNNYQDVDFDDPDTKISLYNLLGHKVMERRLGGDTLNNIMHSIYLSSGVYIQLLELNGIKITKRVVF
ncbi:hypothetical protein MASR2M117_11450 [Paludibacter sp.]